MEITQLNSTYTSLAQLNREQAHQPPFDGEAEALQQREKAPLEPGREEAPAAGAAEDFVPVRMNVQQAMSLASDLAGRIVSEGLSSSALAAHEVADVRLIAPRYV